MRDPHGTHRVPVVAVEIVGPVRVTLKKVHEGGTVRGKKGECARPIEAVMARPAERTVMAVASGRQENAVAVWTSNLIALHIVNRRPRPGAIIDQFLFLFQRWQLHDDDQVLCPY